MEEGRFYGIDESEFTLITKSSSFPSSLFIFNVVATSHQFLAILRNSTHVMYIPETVQAYALHNSRSPAGNGLASMDLQCRPAASLFIIMGRVLSILADLKGRSGRAAFIYEPGFNKFSFSSLVVTQISRPRPYNKYY